MVVNETTSYVFIYQAVRAGNVWDPTQTDQPPFQ